MHQQFTELASLLAKISETHPWLDTCYVSTSIPTEPWKDHPSPNCEVTFSCSLETEAPQCYFLVWDRDEWLVRGNRCPECFDVAPLVDGVCVECGGPNEWEARHWKAAPPEEDTALAKQYADLTGWPESVPLCPECVGCLGGAVGEPDHPWHHANGEACGAADCTTNN